MYEAADGALWFLLNEAEHFQWRSILFRHAYPNYILSRQTMLVVACAATSVNMSDNMEIGAAFIFVPLSTQLISHFNHRSHFTHARVRRDSRWWPVAI